MSHRIHRVYYSSMRQHRRGRVSYGRLGGTILQEITEVFQHLLIEKVARKEDFDGSLAGEASGHSASAMVRP